MPGARTRATRIGAARPLTAPSTPAQGDNPMISRSLNAGAIRLACLLLSMVWMTPGAIAGASVTRLGSSAAFMCYQAAEYHGDFHAGLAECNHALTEDLLSKRDRASTLVNRGIVKVNLNDYAGALADYNAAIEMIPNLAEAYVDRGLLYVRQRETQLEAIADITKGLELGTRDEAAAYHGRAFAYEAVGRVADAYRDFKKAAELNPNWAAPRNELKRFTVHRTNAPEQPAQ